jgi:hypothetical protein
MTPIARIIHHNVELGAGRILADHVMRAVILELSACHQVLPIMTIVTDVIVVVGRILAVLVATRAAVHSTMAEASAFGILPK